MTITRKAWLRVGTLKKLWPVWLMAAGCVALLPAWLFPPSDPIGPRSYERIRLGMAEGEVEEILGMPPGHYYTPPRGRLGPFGLPIEEKGRPPRGLSDAERPLTKEWWGDDYAVEVAFDQSGKVIACSLLRVSGAGPPPSFLDRLLSWLGL
jgi:hypothetical protein